MKLQVIASSSKANCYALHAEGEILLLDAGVPIKRLLKEVKDFRGIVGCVLSHEHMDHARCVKDLLERGVRMICSNGTKDALLPDAPVSQLWTLRAVQLAALNHFTVMPFQTEHDAAEPFGYYIRYEPTGETLLYATDTYFLRFKFPQVNYWVVECNYVDSVIDEAANEGELDLSLRRRLKESHMSLARLKTALAANDLTETRKIVLIHLSDERSDEKRMVSEIAEQTNIEVVAADAGMMIDLELSPF